MIYDDLPQLDGKSIQPFSSASASSRPSSGLLVHTEMDLAWEDDEVSRIRMGQARLVIFNNTNIWENDGHSQKELGKKTWEHVFFFFFNLFNQFPEEHRSVGLCTAFLFLDKTL